MRTQLYIPQANWRIQQRQLKMDNPEKVVKGV
jgi:hypothetical protein